MPIKDWQCIDCTYILRDNFTLNLEQEKELSCPECNKPLEQIIGTPTFITNGDGFYDQGLH